MTDVGIFDENALSLQILTTGIRLEGKLVGFDKPAPPGADPPHGRFGLTWIWMLVIILYTLFLINIQENFFLHKIFCFNIYMHIYNMNIVY